MVRIGSHLLIVCLALAPPAARAAAAPEKVDYNFQIRPILSDRCFFCHGPDEKQRKVGLRLDTREGALVKEAFVPGKPEESELVRRIEAKDDQRMPPAKTNLHLTGEEISLLRRWIAEGAEYKPHWALVSPPDRVPVPAVSEPRWPVGALDHFVLARLDREGLKPSPRASLHDWLRRASFDLTGLPPTLDDITAAEHSTREQVVDRLLASPRFGERMAQEWLDAARYGDSFGYHSDGDSNVWPWRDWVVSAINRNLPFDQFVTWQLAGDLVPEATRETRLATAFNRLHRMTNEGGTIPEEFRLEAVADRVQTFGTVFLGLTFECSRCHDHKFDPLTMRDYYSLGAFFNSIDEWGIYDRAAYRPTPTLALPTPEQERRLEELGGKVRDVERRLAEAGRARASAYQEWLKRSERKAEIPGLVGHYPLDRPAKGKALANLANKAKPGSTSPANEFVAGHTGEALRLTGDDLVDFPGVFTGLDRAQPFTASFWLQLPQAPKQGIVFHRQAGTDSGFHGLELSFDEGRLFFALIRFWPGDAAAVRTRQPLPTGRWIHVAASQDGSGRAAGLRIFLDGRPVELEILRDGLTRNLEAGGTGLTFGERFRSPGLKEALLDEVRLYDRVLSPLEIGQLHDEKSLTDAVAGGIDSPLLAQYHAAALDQELAGLRGELYRARVEWFAAQTGVNEIMTMRELPEPRPAYILARGEYDAPKTRPVSRDTPLSLPPFPKDAPRDRLGLARWLTDPRHPLTARVTVNRFWQMFFGRGLVTTPENFGVQGALPTHPGLLDWLARDFVASGWDLKRLCRTVVLSETYSQRSALTPELRERDPDNLLLARGPSHRLPAEMLRDAGLFAGGSLIEKVGGPPAKPYQPAGLWKGQNNFLPEYVADKGEGLYRRSLYSFWRRSSPPVNMSALDAPTREVCVVRRQTTSTPLQPLVLLNDPQFVEAARMLAVRMLREGGATDAERITFGFRLTATRAPTDRERAVLLRLHAGQRERFAADPESARKYLRVGDRPPPADLDPADLAAAAVVASTLLNLDAALTTR